MGKFLAEDVYELVYVLFRIVVEDRRAVFVLFYNFRKPTWYVIFKNLQEINIV